MDRLTLQSIALCSVLWSGVFITPNALAAEPEKHAASTRKVDNRDMNPGVFVGSAQERKFAKSAESSARLHWHVVLPGESLESIAEQYGLSVDRILRWNALEDRKVNVEDRLKLFVGQSVQQRSLINYWIRQGDTLESLAVRFDMTPEQIIALNGRRARTLRPRNSLKIYAYRGSVVSVPLGSPTRGRLYNGEQMPPGDGYVVRNPKETYGTTRTLNNLFQVVRDVRRKDWGMPPVVIGDISLRRGGYFRPHKSHQNGMDVDVGYVPKDPIFTGRYFSANWKRIDVERSFKLIKAFIDTGQVEYIFVSYWVQRMLYKYARTVLSKEELLTLFQYPRHQSRRVGMIRHSKGHNDHFHVRFLSKEQRVAQTSEAGRLK